MREDGKAIPSSFQSEEHYKITRFPKRRKVGEIYRTNKPLTFLRYSISVSDPARYKLEILQDEGSLKKLIYPTIPVSIKTPNWPF